MSDKIGRRQGRHRQVLGAILGTSGLLALAVAPAFALSVAHSQDAGLHRLAILVANADGVADAEQAEIDTEIDALDGPDQVGQNGDQTDSNNVDQGTKNDDKTDSNNVDQGTKNDDTTDTENVDQGDQNNDQNEQQNVDDGGGDSGGGNGGGNG